MDGVKGQARVIPQLPDLSLIRELRTTMGLSQRDLAARAGVSQSLIAKIEGSGVDPSYGGVRRIFESFEQEVARRVSGKGGYANLIIKDLFTERLIHIEAESTLERGIELMVRGKFTQLPVIDAGRVVGSITDDLIREYTVEETRNQRRPYDEVMVTPVREIMGDPFPILREDTSIELASMHLMQDEAVLVSRRGDIVGILTSADFLNLDLH